MLRRGTGGRSMQRAESPCKITPENPTSHLIGSKVLISTTDGDYQGIVKHVWGDMDKLSLAKVVAIPSKKKFVGVHNFFKQEILGINVLEPGFGKGAKNDRKNQVNLKPLPLNDMDCEDQDQVDCEEGEDEEGATGVPRVTAEDAQIYLKRGNITWEEDVNMAEGCGSPRGFKLHVPNKYIFIDETNMDFQQSIEDIKSCSFVGLAAECSTGRFGEITVLCVATKTFVYLFDIMNLGANAFDRGLRNILESSEITKVVHDCRMLSDALFHLCKVELLNVFDTQVGDVVLYMKENNKKLPQYVRSLSQCIRKYLAFESKFLPKDHHGYEELQRNNELWKIRPFPPSCREASIHSVIFLPELREAIMESILNDLTLGTSIYIDAVKNASKEELALNLGSPHALPPAMSRLTSQEMKLPFHYVTENVKSSYNNIWNENSASVVRGPSNLSCRTVPTRPERLCSDDQCVPSKERPVKESNSKGSTLSERAMKCGVKVNGYSEQNWQHRTMSRSNDDFEEDTLQTGMSRLMSDKDSMSSSSTCSNSAFQEDLKNIRLASNHSSLPKNKCIPAGYMKFPNDRRQGRSPRK